MLVTPSYPPFLLLHFPGILTLEGPMDQKLTLLFPIIICLFSPKKLFFHKQSLQCVSKGFFVPMCSCKMGMIFRHVQISLHGPCRGFSGPRVSLTQDRGPPVFCLCLSTLFSTMVPGLCYISPSLVPSSVSSSVNGRATEICFPPVSQS